MLYFRGDDCREIGALFRIGAKFSIYPNFWRNYLSFQLYSLKSENDRTYTFPA